MPEGETSSPRELLQIALAAAVPLWALELQKQPIVDLLARAQACGQVIAEHGDNILFRAKKKGDTATAFNALAQALAIMALVSPGGVKFLGTHYEFQHPERA